MATLLISDLHLAPERPGILDAFFAVLRGQARSADALYILGDLFEAWVGDDALEEPFNAAVAAELSGLRASGVPVYFQHGNRDFLVGERFAAEVGIELLPEELVTDLGGVRTLLMHGDLLCTDDVDYQALRAKFRSPAFQASFLAQPLALRQALAHDYRRRSTEATARKPEAITDVNADAVASALRRHGCRRLIHGHTHRPAHHVLEVDGQRCDRYVLADWYTRASGLVVGAEVEAVAL